MSTSPCTRFACQSVQRSQCHNRHGQGMADHAGSQLAILTNVFIREQEDIAYHKSARLQTIFMWSAIASYLCIRRPLRRLLYCVSVGNISTSTEQGPSNIRLLNVETVIYFHLHAQRNKSWSVPTMIKLLNQPATHPWDFLAQQSGTGATRAKDHARHTQVCHTSGRNFYV